MSFSKKELLENELPPIYWWGRYNTICWRVGNFHGEHKWFWRAKRKAKKFQKVYAYQIKTGLV